MARAKRTDRADARRRYRKVTATEVTDASDETTAAIPAAARSDRPRSTASNPSEAVAEQPRPSITGAFRSAIGRADVRGDLRALPHIITRTRAVIVPTVLIVVTGLVALVTGAQGNFITVIAFQAFLIPPPLAASFLGGILAPRAAWLVGGLVGLLSAIVFSIVILVAPDDTLRGLFRASGVVPDGFRQAYAAQAFLTAPLLGVAVGAFAGFYRRFLRSSSMNANRSGGRRAPARR